MPVQGLHSYGYNVWQPNSVTVDSTTVLSAATYDPFGPATGWTWGNASTASRAYDVRGLMTSHSLASDTRTLSYDPAGYLTSLSDARHTDTIGYDLLGRLDDYAHTGTAPLPATQLFTYDENGNRRSLTENGTNYTYANDSNRPWLALAAVGAPDTVFLQSTTVLTSDYTWSVTMPTTPGDYELRLFANGTYARLATSDAITVVASPTPGTPFIGVSSLQVETGTQITATLTGGPANPLDVLSFAPVGSPNTSFPQWLYIASTSTFTWSINAPSTPDDYEFRLYKQGDYTILATSDAVNVRPPPAVCGGQMSSPTSGVPFVAVSTLQATTGSSITATVSDGPGNTYDWLAIAPVGSGAFSYLSYVYLNGQTDYTWTLNAPTTPGTYEFRFYEDNTYNLLATSDPVSVQHSFSCNTPRIEVNATRVYVGDPVQGDVVTDSLNISNRLISTSGPTAKTYSYDAAGNVLSDGIHSYGYDDRGRLVTVDTTAATYVHNGQGQRVKKTVASPSLTALFVYDESGNLIGEYDASGNATLEHVWFAGAPVAVISGTDVHYVHTDHLGTPRAITDGNTVIWRWESDPFGSTAAQEDPDGDLTVFTYNLRFPGQYYDQETGLHYNYFRDYDPSIGRYVESDPIGLEGGANTYGYVSQNPASAVDFFGLAECRYYIAEHSIVCTSNDGTTTISHSEGISSGLGECENNPDCSSRPFEGPIWPGVFHMFPNTKPDREGWWALQSGFWVPKLSGALYKAGLIRAGANLHLGRFSQGCITFDVENAAATKAFNEISALLRKDAPNNELWVFPNESCRVLRGGMACAR